MTPEQLTGQSDSHLAPSLIGTKTFLVHSDAIDDLNRLIEAAQLAGFKMEIASGFRDYERQSLIWNRKFSGEAPILDSDSQPLDASTLTEHQKLSAILRWSALPGASRHHWGCDFDVFARNHLPEDTQLQLEPWEYLTGHQQAFYQWLSANASQFGFFFPYSRDLGGVAIEPWHISHRSVSELCLSQLSPTLLGKQLRSKPILGYEIIMEQLDEIYARFVANISH
ncbi:D,D-carboxypeptidase family protein [Vibrio chagasii]|uniref:M15 family metallopeptidase n=1 Tax=Vibrio chagasii TaxID=170679 RepID=UPI001EFED5D8|nr:M15 family metallopeptidase [Vibrio chagasii]MCG9561731.1 M15 family metallopeptidase [Vibrio chagasii]CAH6804052.1 D,D-carboxypeptidase family protein [Vibrio chagasii]CAH6827536.1 D,D-carboxypeptidase family protein [Vibrio chagasii]CAH6855340.1 D,D-carboxypeptidase family protein [Vibrio chagasii]CAH6857421.1 D,D-carboxypeptidase family protein [Vibrio chagasii]